MVYAAKRAKNRCPTHPGALLRDDIIPATGRTKAEIAGLLGVSRQHLYDILQERKPVSPTIAVRLGRLLATAPESGPGCRAPTTPGMQSEPKMSGTFLPSRQRPLRAGRPAPAWSSVAGAKRFTPPGFVTGKTMLPGGPVIQD